MTMQSRPGSKLPALIPLVILCAVGCNPNSALMSVTVGPGGGVLAITAAESTALAGTSITVPAGALAQQVTITISSSSLAVAQPGEVAAGPVADFEPEGTLFAVPVTITLPIAIPTGEPSAALAIEAVEGSGDKRTIAVGSQAGGFATFQTSSFTRFGGVIVQPEDGGSPCTSDSDCSCAQCLEGTCESVVCDCPAILSGCTRPGPGPCCCPEACDGGGSVECTTSADCSSTQYCDSTTCGGNGVCTPRPQACPQYCTFPEVCGCDGQHYCNACIANAAGTSVSADGSACGATDGGRAPCTGDANCPADDFCAASTCGGSGVCSPKPQFCPAYCASPELCGCDGKLYCSECSANAAGTNLSRDGSACGTGLEWYTSCGYPLCSAGSDGGDAYADGGPCPAVETPCAKAGATCGIPSDANCGVIEVCAQADPKAGGCPISSRRFKQEIEYLGEPALQELHDQILQTRLATFHYQAPYGDPRDNHLGFIIEDQPSSPAVDGARSGVDLYSYLGMMVATAQMQEKEIGELRRELEVARKPHETAHAPR